MRWGLSRGCFGFVPWHVGERQTPQSWHMSSADSPRSMQVPVSAQRPDVAQHPPKHSPSSGHSAPGLPSHRMQ
jgi:hypothetical protein